MRSKTVMAKALMHATIAAKKNTKDNSFCIRYQADESLPKYSGTEAPNIKTQTKAIERLSNHLIIW